MSPPTPLRRHFLRSGGLAIMEAAGIALPGLSPDGASQQKDLPPAADAAASKPRVLLSARKAKDFWGLQSVPQVAITGVKTIDKVAPPVDPIRHGRL